MIFTKVYYSKYLECVTPCKDIFSDIIKVLSKWPKSVTSLSVLLQVERCIQCNFVLFGV